MTTPRLPPSCVNWSRTRPEAVVDADGDALDLLLADDFVLVPPPGTPLTKDEYVGAVESGALDFEKFDPISPIDVQRVRSRRGPDLPVRHHRHRRWGRYRSSPGIAHVVYEKAAGTWQVVRAQTTAVGGFPPSTS